jgi:hypothetical protein
VPSRPILRAAAALLLVWIAVDLAAIDTCALDIDRRPMPAQSSVVLRHAPGASTHPHAVLYPDHCFCHGLSTGADTTAALIDPMLIGRIVPDPAPAHLLRASAALDHPPQLSA